jgi:hypothetical protein
MKMFIQGKKRNLVMQAYLGDYDIHWRDSHAFLRSETSKSPAASQTVSSKGRRIKAIDKGIILFRSD